MTSAPSTPQQPEDFRRAVDGLSAVQTRPEIVLGPIRPPQQLAPHTFALGAEVDTGEEGETFGRLILLHDPDGHEAWDGTLRLVTFVQAELDESLAGDSLLPEVAWSWLVDALAEAGAATTALGGTVTATSSVRFGDIAGPTRVHQVELRASWTVVVPDDGPANLTAHAEGFCTLLAQAAGLLPAGVSTLGPPRSS